MFYNPGGAAPLGVIFASLKERTGRTTGAHNSRAPVSTASPSASPRARFLALFGAIPKRPPKGADTFAIVTRPGARPSPGVRELLADLEAHMRAIADELDRSR